MGLFFNLKFGPRGLDDGKKKTKLIDQAMDAAFEQDFDCDCPAIASP